MTEEQYEKINKSAENYLNGTTMPNPIRISSVRSAYITGALEATKELRTQNDSLKKCLRGIIYMVESGMDIKNSVSCFCLLAEAKTLCKE